MTIKDEIIQHCVKLLENAPGGLRFSELYREILKLGINKNSISGNLVRLDSNSNKIYKPSKGLFKHVKYRGDETPEQFKEKNIKEADFYLPFSEWIVNEMEECTKAIALGGAKFGAKWGTPDVIGIKESRKSDIVKLTTEVVTAEIKLDSNQIITAFGQVCAYRLFSHKSYLVIPKSSSNEDLDRIDSLAMIYGIGLVLFDNKNPKAPNFEIRVRAQKHEPDMFYLNENLKLIEKDLF